MALDRSPSCLISPTTLARPPASTRDSSPSSPNPPPSPSPPSAYSASPSTDGGASENWPRSISTATNHTGPPPRGLAFARSRLVHWPTMKVPVDKYTCLDLNAPILPAYQDRSKKTGAIRWRVWCRFCGRWHYHGPGEGHRVAHCNGETPYSVSGYNLVRRRRGGVADDATR